jgi:hypothetical protein
MKPIEQQIYLIRNIHKRFFCSTLDSFLRFLREINCINLSLHSYNINNIYLNMKNYYNEIIINKLYNFKLKKFQYDNRIIPEINPISNIINETNSSPVITTNKKSNKTSTTTTTTNNKTTKSVNTIDTNINIKSIKSSSRANSPLGNLKPSSRASSPTNRKNDDINENILNTSLPTFIIDNKEFNNIKLTSLWSNYYEPKAINLSNKSYSNDEKPKLINDLNYEDCNPDFLILSNQPLLEREFIELFIRCLFESHLLQNETNQSFPDYVYKILAEKVIFIHLVSFF